jgi:uncharacterized membrane protein
MLAGLALKLCPVGEARSVSLLCYSDLKTFFEYRGISTMPFPYINGGMRDGTLLPGSIEYPVLTGIFAWVTAQLAWSPRAYLVVSAPPLGALGLLVAYLLARMAGWRALSFAAAPALVLYVFHNWDLLAVAPAVGGLWCWWRGRPLWAAVLFGVGTCAKLYPLIFVAPLVFEALFASRVREAATRLVAGAGTAVLINLPFAVMNPESWYATYGFHRLRPPNIDSLWGLAFTTPVIATNWPVETLNLLTAVLLLISFGAVFAAGWWRARRDGRYPFVQVCAAALAVFLLWNKVHSPQYILWILPFFALLRTSPAWWVAYTVLDLLLYVMIFYVGPISLDLASPYFQVGVFGRAALLAVLIVVFLGTHVAIREA